MGLPICDLCAKTGILCGACEDRLERKKISDLDVTLAAILYELGKGEIGFERAIEADDAIIVLTPKKDVGKVIGKGGATIRLLSERLGKPVRAISVGDVTATIHDFLAPARVTATSTVYKPGGVTVRRVRVDKRDRGKLRMTVETMEQLLSSISDDDVKITFD